MEPKCPECGGSDFATKFVDNQRAYLVYCSGCGHIISALPDHVELAKTISQMLSNGGRDAYGHPVLHVKTVDQTFG